MIERRAPVSKRSSRCPARTISEAARDRSLHVTEAAGTSQAALWPENAVSRVLPSGLRENNRSRAVAAVEWHRGSSAGRRRARLGWCAAAAGERVGSRPAHRLPFGTGRPRRLPGGAVAWPGWCRRDARGIVRLERCAPRVPDGTAGPHGDGTADPSGTERTATRCDGRGSARDDRHVGPIARSAPDGAHWRRYGRRHELPVPHTSGAEQSDGTGRRRGRQHSDNGGQCCHHRQPCRQRCSDRRAGDRRAATGALGAVGASVTGLAQNLNSTTA